MKLEISASLQEVTSAFSERPPGKITTRWTPISGGGKVAVVQTEEYSVVLQAWTNVTLLLEEIAPNTITVEVKVHIGGGGLMKVSYGSLQKVQDRVLAAFSALPIRVIPS